MEPLVGTAFPTLTHSSQEFAVARLIELADSSRSVTASHLLNVRATLDKWLTPNPVRLGQTDDLLMMLRPTERRGAYMYIGFEGKAPGFTRVDFNPSIALDARLKFGGPPLSAQMHTAQRAATGAVLEQQGFSLQTWLVRRGPVLSHEWVASHPQSSALYYITFQWLDRGTLAVGTKLTQPWLKAAIRQHHASSLSTTVSAAMGDGRLVRIIAGIQWPRHGNRPPTVYFVKVSPNERLPAR